MKKLILTLIFSIALNFVNAQSNFDKFNNQDGVTTMMVNKKMFQMMSNVKVASTDIETQEYLSLIKKLNNLKVYTTVNVKIAADMKYAVEQYVKSTSLKEMIRLNSDGNNLKIWTKSGSSEAEVKELVMLSEEPNKDNQTVLMLLDGSFKLDEIAALIDKMKLPGGSSLKSGTKSK